MEEVAGADGQVPEVKPVEDRRFYHIVTVGVDLKSVCFPTREEMLAEVARLLADEPSLQLYLFYGEQLPINMVPPTLVVSFPSGESVNLAVSISVWAHQLENKAQSVP